jgi:hypothetical protein
MALSSSSSTVALTSTSYLMRDLKLFMWLDIVTSADMLNLNNYGFKENFAFIAFAPNSLSRLASISLDDFSRPT